MLAIIVVENVIKIMGIEHRSYRRINDVRKQVFHTLLVSRRSGFVLDVA